MPSNDYQDIVLSRKAILLLIVVGVVLLTFCYLLGVQVGRNSVLTSYNAIHSSGENLDKLPSDISEQIKTVVEDQDKCSELKAPVATNAVNSNNGREIENNKNLLPTALTNVSVASGKPGPKITTPNKKIEDNGSRWTLQLVSTTDLSEAHRIVNKAQAAGFTVAIVTEQGFYKVRLSKSGNREYVDVTAIRLKAKGFKTFAIKIG